MRNAPHRIFRNPRLLAPAVNRAVIKHSYPCRAARRAGLENSPHSLIALCPCAFYSGFACESAPRACSEALSAASVSASFCAVLGKGGYINGSIDTALRSFVSISITHAHMRGSPSAIKKARGRPSIKRCKITSHLRPRHEVHGPVMPASLKNASPLGNIRASFVGICVCANNCLHSAVKMPCHRHFFGGRLGVKVEKYCVANGLYPVDHFRCRGKWAIRFYFHQCLP